MVELCTQQFFSKQRCVRFLRCSLYDCRAKQDSMLQPFPSYQFPSFVNVDWKMSSKISFLFSAFVLNTSHQPIPAHHFMNTNVEKLFYHVLFSSVTFTILFVAFCWPIQVKIRKEKNMWSRWLEIGRQLFAIPHFLSIPYGFWYPLLFFPLDHLKRV